MGIRNTLPLVLGAASSTSTGADDGITAAAVFPLPPPSPVLLPSFRRRGRRCARLDFTRGNCSQYINACKDSRCTTVLNVCLANLCCTAVGRR